MFCDQCGNQTDDDARFCNSCGADLQIQRQGVEETQQDETSSPKPPIPAFGIPTQKKRGLGCLITVTIIIVIVAFFYASR